MRMWIKMNDLKEYLKSFEEDDSIKFKAKIEFCGQVFYILDNFEYDDIKYFYIIEDKEKELKEAGGFEKYKGKIRMEYIYESEPGIYQTVTDEKLLKQLDIVEAARITSGEI